MLYKNFNKCCLYSISFSICFVILDIINYAKKSEHKEFIICTEEGVSYTLERDKVLVIPSEGFGFEARSTDVNISEVFVVDGVDYTEKSGYYAENSFATDDNPVISDGYETSPDTSDDMPVIVWVAGGSAVLLLLVVLFSKKRK